MAGGAVNDDPNADPSQPSQLTGVLSGLTVLALLIWLGISNVWSLVLVVGLLLSVFLHELGHFKTAGWAGMKRTQFFMGFGPKIWSTHRNGVEYGVRALPLGAFVRIVGMNNLDPVDEGDETSLRRIAEAKLYRAKVRKVLEAFLLASGKWKM